jgi:hypothetical protein
VVGRAVVEEEEEEEEEDDEVVVVAEEEEDVDTLADAAINRNEDPKTKDE